MTFHPLLALGIVVTDSYFAYHRMMRWAVKLAHRAVSIAQPAGIPFLDACGIAVMPIWCALQIAMYLAIAAVADLPVSTLFGDQLDWTLIPRGVLLGVAEASVAMLLATGIFRILAPLRERQKGGDASFEYQTLSQSGWMRSYRSVFRRLPLPLALVVVALPLLGEELIFRATAIPLLMTWGLPAAVILSTICFAAVQVVALPSWYHAVGPVTGALVMGAAHGWLFALQGNLTLPLIAHVTFLAMLIDFPRARGR